MTADVFVIGAVIVGLMVAGASSVHQMFKAFEPNWKKRKAARND